METIEKSFEVLNDLIEINNDRVAGFDRAIKELKDNDSDLKTLFEQFRNDSRDYVHELSVAINSNGGEPEMTTSTTGAIHRAWLDVKGAFTGNDRKSILEECERGEDAIKKAYQEALLPESELSPEFSALLTRQQQQILLAHNQIKAMRDSKV